jgi:AraC-like DNA-binding protein
VPHLQENDLTGDFERGRPAEAVNVEAVGGGQIADTKAYDAESLFHADHSAGRAGEGLEGIGQPVDDVGYREFALPGLGHVLRCAWEQQIGQETLVQRVLPDNCADVLVGTDGKAILVGPATSVELPALPPGTHLRGLRFEPYAIRTVFGLDADELTNRTLPLDAVFPDGLTRAIAEAAAGTGGASSWLARHWHDVRPDWATVRIVRGLTEPGPAAVEAVAERTGYSTRNLRRVVRAETGLSPKTLYRVARLHEFLHQAEAGGLPIGAAAAAAGYADQPHATREVRALTGLSPRRLLAERAAPKGGPSRE